MLKFATLTKVFLNFKGVNSVILGPGKHAHFLKSQLMISKVTDYTDNCCLTKSRSAEITKSCYCILTLNTGVQQRRDREFVKCLSVK